MNPLRRVFVFVVGYGFILAVDFSVTPIAFKCKSGLGRSYPLLYPIRV